MPFCFSIMKSCYRKNISPEPKTLRKSSHLLPEKPESHPDRYRQKGRKGDTRHGGPKKEDREKRPPPPQGREHPAFGHRKARRPDHPAPAPAWSPARAPRSPGVPASAPEAPATESARPPNFPPQLPYQPREVQTVKVQKPALRQTPGSRSRSPAPCLSRFQHPPRPAPRPGSRPRLPPVPPPTVRELQEVSESRGLGQHAAEAMSPQFLASTKARRSEEVPAATV